MKFSEDIYRVVPDPSSLMLAELMDIWKADSSKDKQQACEILTYIHLVSQIDSDAPFASSAETEVRQLATMNIWRDEKGRPSQEELEPFESAVIAYRQAYETEERRAVRVYKNKIDQLTQLLEDTIPAIVKTNSGYKTNVDIINKMMKEMTNLMDAKENLEARIRKSSKDNVNLMGGKAESRLEKKQRSGSTKKKQQVEDESQ